MCAARTSERRTVRLDPGRKVVDSVADWLAARVRTTPSGAKTLSHLLVVVPTAQSGRRLRRALARRFGALVPPRVVMPAALVSGDGQDAVASRTDELVAFMEALGADASADVAAQLCDLRMDLGANALLFSDVAAKAPDLIKGECADLEVARWRRLAELEAKYLASLERRGLRDRVVAVKLRLAGPIDLGEAEEVVVACVLDPIPAMRVALDAAGLPVTELEPEPVDGKWLPLARSQIVPCGTAASESWRIAEVFACVRPDEALPALCLADQEMLPEVQGALQAKGIAAHSPSRTRLSTSSLGRLVAQMCALARTSSYSVFSAFVRGGDVRRWACASLGITDDDYTAALTELDMAQARLLPERMEDIGPMTEGTIRRIYDLVVGALQSLGLRGLLESVFAGKTLDERDADAREFAAAAECVEELLSECFAEGVPESVRLDVFARRLEEATYSLEPDEGDVVEVDGWLEIPFLDADELVVSGFQEGCVPESAVGHAYLPDSLRKALGLPCNDSRAARDAETLRLALSCRPAESVRVFFHSVDAAGDVLRPSRLLFLCEDVEDLVGRVREFYASRAGTDEAKSADLPVQWRLALPIPPERAELVRKSVSRLDDYLKCPFTYYLREVFGERIDDRAEELRADEFGTLAHQALDGWAKGPLAASDDAAAIAGDLRARIDGLLAQRFGDEVPIVVALQGESLARRLSHFAEVQVQWRRAGWRIVATERRLSVRYGHTEVRGCVDRVDRNDRTGEWCVIDYKTWDSAERAAQRSAKTGEWKSVQLALYVAMLDADSEGVCAEARRAAISSRYCVLGKTRENVLFSDPVDGALLPEAEAVVRKLIDGIESGVFWPPGPKSGNHFAWEWDYARMLGDRPEASVSPEWLDDQERRLRARTENS